MHRPLVLRPSAAGITTDSVTFCIADKQSSMRVGAERKKKENGKKKEKREKMSRIFEKKHEKNNNNKSINWPLPIFKS